MTPGKFHSFSENRVPLWISDFREVPGDSSLNACCDCQEIDACYYGHQTFNLKNNLYFLSHQFLCLSATPRSFFKQSIILIDKNYAYYEDGVIALALINKIVGPAFYLFTLVPYRRRRQFSIKLSNTNSEERELRRRQQCADARVGFRSEGGSARRPFLVSGLLMVRPPISRLTRRTQGQLSLRRITQL